MDVQDTTRHARSFCLGFLLLSAATGRAVDADPVLDRGPVLVFNEENDLFVNTDRHYTQGIKFGYFHEDGHLPLGMEAVNSWIPALGYRQLSARSGYTVGQNMYTPANLQLITAQPADRPYAGWLYVGLALQRDGVTEEHSVRVQESVELELGAMGSPSLARQAQTWVHQIRGFDLPLGWRNQLRDEPGFRLKAERAYRFEMWSPGSGFGADFIPFGGFVAGTIEDSARIGGIMRLGYLLPDNFGVRINDSLSTTGGGRSRSQPRNWGAHVFLGTEGRFVGRNAFLEGNLWRSSPNISKLWLVGDAFLGFNVVIYRFEIGYTHVFRSPEFHGETEHNEFGSVHAGIQF